MGMTIDMRLISRSCFVVKEVSGTITIKGVLGFLGKLNSLESILNEEEVKFLLCKKREVIAEIKRRSIFIEIE